MTKKKINPIEVVQEQYRQLKEKLESTRDIQEKNILFRRLANLLAVMQFLVSTHKDHGWKMSRTASLPSPGTPCPPLPEGEG